MKYACRRPGQVTKDDQIYKEKKGRAKKRRGMKGGGRRRRRKREALSDCQPAIGRRLEGGGARDVSTSLEANK